jgi:hypothetical protein
MAAVVVAAARPAGATPAAVATRPVPTPGVASDDSTKTRAVC